ncbi:MAG: hypothetical protein R3C12_02405 [Planctomycetaceae bacterium]
MFLTCSIRRKLFVQFALVIVMVVMMASSAIVGLVSYRGVVADLKYSINDAPRKADLIAAIDVLFEPLSMQPRENAQHEPEVFAAFQHTQFRLALNRSKDGIRVFLKRLDELPPHSIPPETYTLLRTNVVHAIELMENLHPQLIDPQERSHVAGIMLQRLVALHQFVNGIPDPSKCSFPGWPRRKNLRVCLNLVIASSIIAFGLFLAVMGFSNVWIFEPIKTLHKAARARGQWRFSISCRTQFRRRNE